MAIKTLKPGQKTVLITGCSPGGIGHALALEFHSKGLHVIATARRSELLHGLESLGMSTLPLDVTSKDSIAACKRDVVELTGAKLDILVNNAGRTHTIPATDIDLDDVRNTFETNVFGVMAMVQAFVPLLISTRGLIVQISSLSSISPYIFGAAYCATKAAVNAYSRTLRQELRPFGVRVMVSMTGTVKSNTANLHRELPSDSLYLRVKEIFQWRLTFSQTTSATVQTKDFAAHLVKEAIKGEGWFGGLIGGTRNWFWDGGLSTTVWFASWFGEWLLDQGAYRKFGLWKLEAMVKRDGLKKVV